MEKRYVLALYSWLLSCLVGVGFMVEISPSLNKQPSK